MRALSDDTRFQIVWLLLENDLCVGALARILNTSKPAVSQHLKILREAGLVKGEKRGYWTHYMVEEKLLREAAKELQELADGQKSCTSGASYVCLRKQGNEINEIKESESERRVLQMCKNCCQQPDKLKTKPEECTPEQIKECHGDDQGHPCENEKQKDE
ncbi:MAG: metalloregulator ArsR/SmtB family transcription factor [Bacillota bacterium]